MVELVAEDSEVIKGRSSILGVCASPLDEECSLVTSGHHGKTGTLSNKPRVVVGESNSVGILTSRDQGHLGIVNQVLKEPGEELSKPPHAHEVAARGVVFPLPLALEALVELLLVVVSITLDDVLGDLLVDGLVEGQRDVLA